MQVGIGAGPISSSAISGAGKTDYTLAAAQGTYSVAGKAAVVGRLFALVAATTTYSIAGKAAVINAQRNLSAAQGTYAVTGQAVVIGKHLIFAAVYGVYQVMVGSFTHLFLQRFTVIAPILGLKQLRKFRVALKDLRTDAPVLQLIRKNPPTLK